MNVPIENILGGVETEGGPEAEVTDAAPNLTGLWVDDKFAIPERLKATHASIKFSGIRIRK